MADMVLEDSLTVLGYRPEDDAWETDGRRTYSHDENATRAYLTTLRGILARQGWHRDTHALRTFRHEASEQVLEIEPGGADCSGHYLHHMKAAVIA
jgi:hypothetical protein